MTGMVATVMSTTGTMTIQMDWPMLCVGIVIGFVAGVGWYRAGR